MLWIAAALLLAGCAGRGGPQPDGDANATALEYNKDGYRLTYAKDEELAERGFPKASLKMAFLVYRGLVAKPKEYMLRHASYAYRHGLKKAGIILADEALSRGRSDEALRYLESIDFADFSHGDWRDYIAVADKLPEPARSDIFKKIEEIAQKDPKAAYELAKYYEKKEHFQKAIRYYEIAYKEGKNIEAGVRLGRLYLDLGQEKKGLYILRRIAKKDDGKAARIVAKYLYGKLQKKLREMNTPPIVFTFKEPREFFAKKMRIKKYEELYMQKNVVPWYRLAYERGNVDAMLDLIVFDIERDTLLDGSGYSGFDLEEAVKYLQSVENSWRAKLILAKIYETYTQLGKMAEAKRIYEEYIKKDKVDAYWHLYQYAKRYEPAHIRKYLDYLVEIRFVPAMIEKAYLELLEHKNIEENHRILRYYAQRKNLVAMRYLASIYAKKIIPGVDPTKACDLLYEVAALEYPLNARIDLRAAVCYLRIYPKRDILKAATIYKFYSDLGRPEAKYAMAKLYKDYFQDYEMVQKYLAEAKEEGYREALTEYYTLVARGEIEGDVMEALRFLEEHLEQNPKSYLLLATIYARGYPAPHDLQKAIDYYKKAMELGSLEAYYRLAKLYYDYDIAGEYRDRIVPLLQELIQKSADITRRRARYLLARYYFRLGETKKAIRELKEILRYRPADPKARAMLYEYTGDPRYLYVRGRMESDFGPLVLHQAMDLERKDPQRALLFAFRAMLCRTPRAERVAYQIIRDHFRSPKKVYSIFRQAKRMRPCYLER